MCKVCKWICLSFDFLAALGYNSNNALDFAPFDIGLKQLRRPSKRQSSTAQLHRVLSFSHRAHSASPDCHDVRSSLSRIVFVILHGYCVALSRKPTQIKCEQIKKRLRRKKKEIRFTHTQAKRNFDKIAFIRTRQSAILLGFLVLTVKCQPHQLAKTQAASRPTSHTQPRRKYKTKKN